MNPLIHSLQSTIFVKNPLEDPAVKRTFLRLKGNYLLFLLDKYFSFQEVAPHFLR